MLRRYAFIGLIIVVLVAAAALAGAGRVPASSVAVSMIATTIAVATPLTLGALSGVLCERAGVVNIGIEGMMLAAAFFGWAGALYASAVWHMAPLPSLLFG